MSALKANTEAFDRLAVAFREMGEQMIAGVSQLDQTLVAEAMRRKLYRIEDQWLRIWVLHLSQTTYMDFDKAWSYVVWKSQGGFQE